MSSPRSEVFCDFFTITTPKDNHDALLEALLPFFSQMRCSLEPYGYRLYEERAKGGLFSWRLGASIASYSASGSFVKALRDNNMLVQFLAEIALFPHNVSSADFTVDEYVHAPPRIRQAYELASTGGISFTRKALKPAHVRALLRPCIHPDRMSDGDTGTLYLGSRGNHEVHSKLYDKQHHAFVEFGAILPPTLRHELTVSKRMGITLRDLCLPASCFYHFYPPELLSPADVPPWQSFEGGYILTKAAPRLPSQVLRDRVETSEDLLQLFEIADKIGSEGFTYLLRLITNSYQRRMDPSFSIAA